MIKFSTSAALVSLALLSGCIGESQVGSESRSIAIDESAAPTSAVGGQDSTALSNAIRATSPTFVTMTVSGMADQISPQEKNMTPISSGSGFVVSSDGYVITAAHVAAARYNMIAAVAANGRAYTGTVVAINPANDLALVKLHLYNGTTTVPAGPACTAMGATVYSLGKPHGLGDTVRVGSLQAMHFGRAVNYGKYGYPDAMVLHMATQRGESGGPVFNAQGQLIGMVVSTLSDAQGQSITMAHAIPSNTVAQFICSNITCSPQWAQLAARPVDNCS